MPIRNTTRSPLSCLEYSFSQLPSYGFRRAQFKYRHDAISLSKACCMFCFCSFQERCPASIYPRLAVSFCCSSYIAFFMTEYHYFIFAQNGSQNSKYYLGNYNANTIGIRPRKECVNGLLMMVAYFSACDARMIYLFRVRNSAPAFTGCFSILYSQRRSRMHDAQRSQ